MSSQRLLPIAYRPARAQEEVAARTKQLRRVEEAVAALRKELAHTAAEYQAARERLLADIRALTKQVKLKASARTLVRVCKPECYRRGNGEHAASDAGAPRPLRLVP